MAKYRENLKWVSHWRSQETDNQINKSVKTPRFKKPLSVLLFGKIKLHGHYVTELYTQTYAVK